MLKENNVRKGFLIHDQYTLVRNALTEYLKPVLAMGYFTGMRQGEILPLRWEQVSLTDSQVLLDPKITKNDEPRPVSTGFGHSLGIEPIFNGKTGSEDKPSHSRERRKFGWEAWTRTRIARSRVWSPTNWTTSQRPYYHAVNNFRSFSRRVIFTTFSPLGTRFVVGAIRWTRRIASTTSSVSTM